MSGDELDKSLVDGFTAAAVILAAITVLFGVRYPEVTKVLDETPPGTGAGQGDLRASYRRRLRDTLYARLLPLLILFWAFTLLPLPATVQIVGALDLVPGHYDFIRAAWAVTEAMMLYFAVWTTRLAIKLYTAIRKAPAV
jgi:hypothetical protein